jgi:hypothetical protein
MDAMFWTSRRVAGMVCVSLVLALIAAVPGNARDDEMRREGSCSAHSDWRLEVRHEDANMLQVRFRIDHTPNGAVWEIFLSDNGSRFFAGTRSSGSNGELQVRKHTPDRSGTDRIKGYGYSRASGEVCSGVIKYDR